MLKNFLLICVVAIQASDISAVICKDPSITWTGGSFLWPCGATKSIYKNAGLFIPKNVIATRAQIYNDDAYLVLPRFKEGVPVTLVKTSLKQKGCQALLEAYPCWSYQEEGRKDAIQNAVDLFLDPQDILWVLDVGIINTLEQPIQKSSPKVVAFNVKTNKVLKVIDLSGLVVPASRLQYLVVDYAPCGRCFLYISDAAARAILVYDVIAGKGYRVVLPQDIIVGSENKRDVLYLALIRKCDSSTVLYFTYLSSQRLFSINTEYLRAGTSEGHIQDIGIKPQPIIILGTDNGSAMFFRYEGSGNIYRWDTNTCFCPNNFILVYRDDNCLLSTHVLADYKRSRMRILKSNFPDYIQNTVGCGAVQSLSLLEGNHL